MMSGRKRLHFSNNKGYINNAVFEGVITSETYSDRVLGKTRYLTLIMKWIFLKWKHRNRFYSLILEIDVE